VSASATPAGVKVTIGFCIRQAPLRELDASTREPTSPMQE
jgi:hypothetical protein